MDAYNIVTMACSTHLFQGFISAFAFYLVENSLRFVRLGSLEVPASISRAVAVKTMDVKSGTRALVADSEPHKPLRSASAHV